MPLQGAAEPWYGRRAILAALVLFIAVTVLRAVVESPREAITVLYVIPVAIVAIELGLVAGLVAAVVSFAAFVVWDQVSDAGVTAIGYLSRAGAFGGIALVVGTLAERLRHAERRVSRLSEAEDFSSSVVQSLTVAHLALERGETAEARDAVGQTLRAAVGMVGDHLPDDVRPGDFRVAPRDAGREA